jgi:hypothetical protein
MLGKYSINNSKILKKCTKKSQIVSFLWRWRSCPPNVICLRSTIRFLNHFPSTLTLAFPFRFKAFAAWLMDPPASSHGSTCSVICVARHYLSHPFLLCIPQSHFLLEYLPVTTSPLLDDLWLPPTPNTPSRRPKGAGNSIEQASRGWSLVK